MLTQEEWGKLTPEEQETRQAEKPQEAQEDVVVIGGKPRPLKNFIEEITRKTKESVMAEMNATKPSEKKPDAVANADWKKNIASAAEKEMEETGSIVPVNTILNLINQGTNYHLSQFATSNKNAQKIIKETKKELKASYKDYSEYEDKFDDLLDNIEPQNVSKEGLKIIFNSLRGENLDAIIKKKTEDAVREATEGKQIIGDISSGSGSASGERKPTKLNAEQKQQMTEMGFESEEDYLGRVKHYQEVAKKRGATNVPQLLAEKLIYAK